MGIKRHTILGMSLAATAIAAAPLAAQAGEDGAANPPAFQQQQQPLSKLQQSALGANPASGGLEGERALPAVQNEVPGGLGQPPRTDNLGRALEDLVESMGGGGPERLQELGRLREAREMGGLDAAAGAFGEASKCRRLGAQASLGTGCGGEDAHEPQAPRGREGPGGPGYALGPGGGPHSPDPRAHLDPERGSGDGGVRGGPAGSATGRAGVKDPRGRAGQDAESDDDGQMDMVFDEQGGVTEYDDQGRVVYRETPDADGEGWTEETTHYFDDGGSITHTYHHEDENDVMGTPKGSTYTGPIKPEDGSSSGERGQPDPTDTGGGEGPWQCTAPGASEGACKQAAESGKSEFERAREAAPRGGRDVMTPEEIFERTGQPMPAPGRGAAAERVEDGRDIAGFTPGCDASPGGCGGEAGHAGMSSASRMSDFDW